MQETRIRSMGWEDPSEEEIVTHSSILAWKILWTEEHGRLQSIGLQSWTQLSIHSHTCLKSSFSLFLYFWCQLFWLHSHSSSLYGPHVLISSNSCFELSPPHFSLPRIILFFLSLLWSISLSSLTFGNQPHKLLCSSVNSQGNHKTTLRLVSRTCLRPQRIFFLCRHPNSGCCFLSLVINRSLQPGFLHSSGLRFRRWGGLSRLMYFIIVI